MKSNNVEALADSLRALVHQVQQDLGRDGAPADVATPFADLLDSMGMVEFLLRLAEELGTTSDAIEKAAERNFSNPRELAGALLAAGLISGGEPATVERELVDRAGILSPQSRQAGCWLGGVSCCLPDRVQGGSEINRLLYKPEGWLEKHAGIHQRRLWGDQDPLVAAARAAQQSLERAGIDKEAVGVLLVTSEAPPLFAGTAAAVHARLGLAANVPALDVGAACTGFLAALWLARDLLPRAGAVLVIAVECHSSYLKLEPGPAGEAAALFGDAAAACTLCAQPPHAEAVPLTGVSLGADGASRKILQVVHGNAGFGLHMDGQKLAGRAVKTMARAGRELLASHGVELSSVQAVVAHGGNGRMPALLARLLDMPPDKVWSATPETGNLGSASLPVAWAINGPVREPVLWTAVGAGLTWGAALTGAACR